MGGGGLDSGIWKKLLLGSKTRGGQSCCWETQSKKESAEEEEKGGTLREICEGAASGSYHLPI